MPLHISRLSKILLITATVLLIIFAVLSYFLSFRKSDAAAVKEFSKQGIHLSPGAFINNGNCLHYVGTGADTLPTIVFIHGSPGSWTAYEDYLKDSALRSKFRLISIDRPGFGYSNYGHAMHLKNECDLIAMFLQQIQNNKPMYLVGHSMGGPVAVQLAADYPSLMQGIVVLAGAVDPSLEAPEKWRAYFIHRPWCWLVPGAMGPSNEELWYLKKDLYPLKDELQKITCRVYVLHGQKDELVDVRNAGFMKTRFTNAKSYYQNIFPNENHFIPWTQTNVIKRLLLGLPQVK